MLSATPAIAIVLWHMAFISIGAASLAEDQDLRKDSCGQYHIVKYASLNVVFAFFSLVTFFVFPGGGEGARARAVLLIVLHLAFAVWGGLMFSSFSPACETVLTDKFGAINQFQQICIAHNACFAVLVFLHELFSDRLGADHTIIFEISKSPYPDNFAPKGDMPHIPAPQSAPPPQQGFGISGAMGSGESTTAQEYQALMQSSGGAPDATLKKVPGEGIP
jgi:hypothetical protein